MGAFKINFALRRVDKIKPFGEKPRLALHWFGLTDGTLWIDVGDDTVYEYSKAARREFGGCSRYNDYYIARFLEDFFDTLGAVGEPVPKALYDRVDTFADDMAEWEKLRADCDDAELEKFYGGEFIALYDFFSARSFDSGHLVNGPVVGCFRCGDTVKIVWDSYEHAENGESIWTAARGCFETGYGEFVASVRDFYERFFAAMDGQVERAVQRKWGRIALDKAALVKEHADRRKELAAKLELLGGASRKTDWDGILSLYAEMRAEVDGRT